MSFPPGQKQQCPVCKHWMDVSNFTSGQRIRCTCGITFLVRKEFISDEEYRSNPRSRTPFFPQAHNNIQTPTPPVRSTEQTYRQATPIDPSTLKTEVPGPADDPSMWATDPDRSAVSLPAEGVQIQRLRGQAAPQMSPTIQRSPFHQENSQQADRDAQMRRQYQQFQKQYQPQVAPHPPTPPQVPAAPLIPSSLPVFNGFTIVERLGQGGMGEVWKARRKADGLLVAIKVLSAELANDESLCVRFEKEVAALASLDHPGIVKLVHHDFRRRPPFFAMELCDGETLRERMSKPTFSMQQRLTVFSNLCRVLEHAHRRGVIHRDLKPDNVLFDRQGNLKLIDFGLATLTNGDPRYQLTGVAMTMGTADYMPPEQRTDAKTVDARGDVWSLGIILYELIGRTLPVGHFKPLVERMPGLDPRIDDLVQRALIHDREKRLQSAGEMADAIDEILAGPTKPKIQKPLKNSNHSPVGKFLNILRGK